MSLTIPVACGDHPVAPAAASTVAVNPPTASMLTGDTLRLTAVVKDASGTALDRPVSWSSGTPGLATVSASGLVTATQAGLAKIAASIEGVSGEASVTITQRPSAKPAVSLTLEYSTVLMGLRSAYRPSWEAKDEDGAILTGRTPAWTSSDPATVSVASDGTLTAQKAGSASVKVALDGKEATTTVTVIAFSSIVAGAAETCALSTTGRLYCAGARQGPSAKSVAPTLTFKKLFSSARGGHDAWCATTTADVLYCWGTNAGGELGVGDSLSRAEPTAVLGGLKFSSVAFGSGQRGGTIVNGVVTPAEAANHMCGITLGNELYCWGDGRSGQFGTGGATASVTPVRVAPDLLFTDVTAGRMYTCGVTTASMVYCWGDNTAGHVGTGTWSETPVWNPTPLPGTRAYRAISGAGATCAIATDDDTYCWGDNTLAKIGPLTGETCFGAKPCVTSPKKVSAPVKFALIRSSQSATCALDAGGTMYCWGMNVADKFGVAIPAGCVTPNTPAACTGTPTPGPTGLTSLSVAATTSCAMQADGGAYCWGGNESGQLASPGVTTSMKPLPFTLHPTAKP